MKLSLEGRVEVRHRTDDSFQAEFGCKDTQRRWVLFWSLHLEWERESRLRVELESTSCRHGGPPHAGGGNDRAGAPQNPLLDKRNREEAVGAVQVKTRG